MENIYNLYNQKLPSYIKKLGNLKFLDSHFIIYSQPPIPIGKFNRCCINKYVKRIIFNLNENTFLIFHSGITDSLTIEWGIDCQHPLAIISLKPNGYAPFELIQLFTAAAKVRCEDIYYPSVITNLLTHLIEKYLLEETSSHDYFYRVFYRENDFSLTITVHLAFELRRPRCSMI